MNLIKCEKEHYYDADKFDTCPHCANMIASGTVADIQGKEQNVIDTAIPNDPVLQNYKKIGHRKVTGWLVCIDGYMAGESFTLYEGINHIGRASHMDVVLFKEPTVSRENHALITYNQKTNKFLLASDNQQTVLYNKKTFSQPQDLHAYDTVQLGNCTLTFIPFCGEHFSWKRNRA